MSNFIETYFRRLQNLFWMFGGGFAFLAFVSKGVDWFTDMDNIITLLLLSGGSAAICAIFTGGPFGND